MLLQDLLERDFLQTDGGLLIAETDRDDRDSEGEADGDEEGGGRSDMEEDSDLPYTYLKRVLGDSTHFAVLCFSIPPCPLLPSRHLPSTCSSVTILHLLSPFPHGDPALGDRNEKQILSRQDRRGRRQGAALTSGACSGEAREN